MKYNFLSTIVLIVLISSFPEVYSQTTNPDFIVAIDGSGDFQKIQDAIDAVQDNNPLPTIIFIKRGLYNTEKLLVPSNKKNVVLVGESKTETIISYHIYDCGSGGFNNKCPAADAQLWQGEVIQTSATLTISGDGFVAENLTIENTAGPVGQALAITIKSDKVIFRNCIFSSYQDTIYLWSNAKRIYFETCLVIGRTDYIYGSGTAWFENSEIRSWGGGWITAPSTGLNQTHGFVFNNCQITYALNSPRAGDDGATIALGRPWHNYPKVTWINCLMTEKINPLGWPTKWNMDYADTSSELKLYEYNNYGPGADMSGRANWVGIRALRPQELPQYTLEAVLGGTDNWDPTSTPYYHKQFKWTGNGSNKKWTNPLNWFPNGNPKKNESALVDGQFEIEVQDHKIEADLSLLNGATLNLEGRIEFQLLLSKNGKLKTTAPSTILGKLEITDSLLIENSEKLILNGNFKGAGKITKSGLDTLEIKNEHPNFTGFLEIHEGFVNADFSGCLKSITKLILLENATLIVNQEEILDITCPVFLNTGSTLYLSRDLILTACYLDGQLMNLGSYSNLDLPNLIHGPGNLIIGRPNEFRFSGAQNGNWDVAENFVPALIPQTGETVFTEREMETTPYNFLANIVVESSGRIRLRGEHTASGIIKMESGSSLSYATSGFGFSLNAPMIFEGQTELFLNSKAIPNHTLTLLGNISGDGWIRLNNQRDDTPNEGIVELSGNNSGFTGIWDLTVMPGNANSTTTLLVNGENSLGESLIQIGLNHKLILDHSLALSDSFKADLFDDAKIQLNKNVRTNRAFINGLELGKGTFNPSSHPQFFTGNGNLEVLEGVSKTIEPQTSNLIFENNNTLYIKGNRTIVSVYDFRGIARIKKNTNNEISLAKLRNGIYVVKYLIDGKEGELKVLVTN